MSNDLDWVPQTKTQPPQLRSDIIERERLVRWLDENSAVHPLCLLSAPAGYGKTTLLAAWMKQTKPAICKTYLLIDAEDDNPSIFLSGLLMALRRLNPTFGESFTSFIDNPTFPGLRRLFGVMINEIIQSIPEPFALVFDDYHLINSPEIHAALDYLVEHLPTQMHIVISSRADPPLALARLRARGQLAELRLPGLRFTLDETKTFINQRLGYRLPDPILRQLLTSAEGWAAGLRLLAASLESMPATNSEPLVLEHLNNSRELFNVLADEVLDRQPQVLRAFLLETSILHELTPDLCRAVTQQADAHLLLEEIHRRNLFTAVQDEDGTVGYQYHALFRAFLLQQLGQERTAENVIELHLRAGRAETNFSRAIAHFMAAHAWDTAAEKIEQVAEKEFSLGHLDRLYRWIAALPVPTVQKHPWLDYFRGVCAWGKNDFSHARTALESALEGFRQFGDERGQGEALIQLSIVHQTAGDFYTAGGCLDSVSASAISARSRVQLHLSRAWIALGYGDLEDSQVELAAAIEAAEKDPSGALQLLAMQVRIPFSALPQASALFQRTAQLIEQRSSFGRNPWRAGSDAQWMMVHFLRGNLDLAVQAGERAFSESEAYGGLSWLMSDLGSLFPRLLFLSGNAPRAERILEQYQHIFDDLSGWRASALYLRGLSLWDAKRYDEARTVYQHMQEIPAGYEWPVAGFSRACMEGLLSLSNHDYARAEKIFIQACDLWQKAPVSGIVGDPRLLLAAAYQYWGKQADALRVLEPVLVEHRGKNTPGLLLMSGTVAVSVLKSAVDNGIVPDFASLLLQSLQRLSGPHSQPVPSTGEILTPREVEILRLLSAGATNVEIANSLFIGLPTVKTHVSRVLAKLDARSRTEAVAVARSLRII